MVESRSWFEKVDASNPLSEKDCDQIAKILDKSLEKGTFNPSKIKLGTAGSRVLFLCAICDGRPMKVFSGHGESTLDALEMAFDKFMQAFEDDDSEVMIKLDIVTEYKLITNCNADTKFEIIRGIEGVAYKDAEIALLPEQLAYNRLINEDGDLSENRIYNYLESEPMNATLFAMATRSGRYDVYLFKTENFVLEGKEFTKLFRAQYLHKELNKDILKHSIELAAYYLKNCVNSFGRFDYLYFADNNYSSKDYGVLRHAGTLFSMLEYYEAFKDKSMIEPIERGISYLERFLKPGLEDAKTLCVLERGAIKLGGNGLAALVFAKYAALFKNKERKNTLEKICNWMITQVNEDGSFKGHKQYYPKGNYSGAVSDYYPGEVIYGLMLANKVSPNKRWVDACNKIAHWLIDVRDKDVATENLQHDHWLLYSFNELYRVSPHPDYLEHTQRIVASIIGKQNLDVKYPDFHGSYYKGDPRSTPAATRSEGLLAAYRLISEYDKKNKVLASSIFDCAQRTICFQLRMQYNELTSSYLAYQDKAYGGFRGSIALHDIRIDYNQHSLSSLITMYKLISQPVKVVKEKVEKAPKAKAATPKAKTAEKSKSAEKSKTTQKSTTKKSTTEKK